MRDIRIFPGLRKRAIIPNVPVVRKAVANKSQLALFRVYTIVVGVSNRVYISMTLLNTLDDWIKVLFLANFELCIGPARNFNNLLILISQPASQLVS